ncbi:MAG: IS110 family transposase [Paracoccaceae bacterium]
MMMVAHDAELQEAVCFVGVDVGKHTCVAAVQGRPGVFSFTPDAAGIAGFLSQLRDLPGAVRVGLEASGGYEAALWEALEAAGVAVRQRAPAKVHAYAKSVGRRAKTDACDAATIAAYMAANPTAGRQIPPANIREISALTAKRRQLIAMRKALSCQTKQAHYAGIAPLNAEMMMLIEAQIVTVEETIDRRIETDADLAAKRRLLRSIPGIGAVSAFTLLACMPELGTLAPGAAAALAGLAPFARDSGTISGPRFIHGGRSAVRDVLYMAAISASAHKDSQKPFADRLKARNKPGKQIIIAVARKRIEIANSVLARETEWQVRSA